jgi:TPP-dependent pyruvate/acetoin dehydrogenase alpha subunit
MIISRNNFFPVLQKIMMPRETLIEWYRQMVLIRRLDEKRAKIAGEPPTPQQHPHFGQEAIALLGPDDYVLGAHRCIGYAITKGLDLKRKEQNILAAIKKVLH